MFELSNVLRYISICDLFTESPLYKPTRMYVCNIIVNKMCRHWRERIRHQYKSSRKKTLLDLLSSDSKENLYGLIR
jgi:hypothetical protein